MLPSEIGPSGDSTAAAEASRRPPNSLQWVNGSKRARRRRGVETGVTILGAGPSNHIGPTDERRDIDEVQDPKGAEDKGVSDLCARPSSSLGPIAALTTDSEAMGPGLSHDVALSKLFERSARNAVNRDEWLPTSSTVLTGMLNLPPLLSQRNPRLRLLFNHCMSDIFPDYLDT